MLTKERVLIDNPGMSESLAESILRAYKACKSVPKTEYPENIQSGTQYITNTLCDTLGIHTQRQRIIIANIIQKNACSESIVNRALYIAQRVGNGDIFGTVCGLLTA